MVTPEHSVLSAGDKDDYTQDIDTRICIGMYHYSTDQEGEGWSPKSGNPSFKNAFVPNRESLEDIAKLEENTLGTLNSTL